MKKPQFKKRYTENSAEVQEYMDYIASYMWKVMRYTKQFRDYGKINARNERVWNFR